MNLKVDYDYLISTVQQLSKARSLDEIAVVVRKAARQLAKADGATFVLREDGNCHYFDEDAIAPLWKGLRFPMEACISGVAMMTGETVAIPDIYKDSRIPIAAYKPTFVKSLLMTPVRKEAPIAAIGVYWSQQYEPTQMEKDILMSLANSTAVAMQNVDLNASLERKIVELEAAAVQKDQFLKMLSHELRTPMNSILGWSQILKETLPAHEDSDVRDGINAIHRNAQTEMRLISDLLDSSQIISGQMSLRKHRIHITEALDQAIKSARMSLAKKSQQLQLMNLVHDLEIDADPDRLQQIIGNLLNNASKFTPVGGDIEIELTEDSDAVVLAVQDNGEGISSELMPKIFDRFQSQNPALNRKHGGMGLGLAISKSLVEAHGGTIKASSPGIDQGARFEVRLPKPQSDYLAPAIIV